MKELVLTWLEYVKQNPHPSLAAVVLFAASVVGVLWPEHKHKADEIARLAMCYGIINANYTTHAKQNEKQLTALLKENEARQASFKE